MKRSLKFLLSAFLVCFFGFNVFAFDRSFFNSDYVYKDKKIKNSNIESKKEIVEKGFCFKMVFDTKSKSVDPVNFADVVVRHIRKLAKEKFGEKLEFVKSLFENYEVIRNRDEFVIKFYVFAENKEDLEEILDFFRKKFSDKNYKQVFGVPCSIKENEFKEYIELYVNSLDEKLAYLNNKIRQYYDEKNYKQIRNIFSRLSKDIATSTNFLSVLMQDNVIRKKAKLITDILERIIKNKFKGSKDLEDSEDYEILDYYYSGYGRNKYYKSKVIDYFEDEEDLRKFFKFNNTKGGCLSNFRKLFITFFEDCKLNLNKLSKKSFSNFKNSLNSLSFGYKISTVKREITTFNGSVEIISRT